MSSRTREVPRVTDDLLKRRAPWLPTEVRADARARCDEHSRIALPAWRFFYRDVCAGDRAGRVDDLADRVSRAVAQVVDVVTRRLPGVEREEVRAGEVVDVDVIAHRRPIGCRIVG